MEKFIIRKTINHYKNQFLRYPAENVHGDITRKKYQIDFAFVSFSVQMNFRP